MSNIDQPVVAARGEEARFAQEKPMSAISDVTQAKALSMMAVQVMANDVAIGLGGAGGHLKMIVYKPLIIFNITNAIALMTDGCIDFSSS